MLLIKYKILLFKSRVFIFKLKLILKYNILISRLLNLKVPIVNVEICNFKFLHLEIICYYLTYIYNLRYRNYIGLPLFCISAVVVPLAVNEEINDNIMALNDLFVPIRESMGDSNAYVKIFGWEDTINGPIHEDVIGDTKIKEISRKNTVAVYNSSSMSSEDTNRLIDLVGKGISTIEKGDSVVSMGKSYSADSTYNNNPQYREDMKQWIEEYEESKGNFYELIKSNRNRNR